MEVILNNNWSDITISDYLKLVEAINMDSKLLNKEMRILEVLTNLSYSQIEDLSVVQLKQLVNKLGFLNSSPQGSLKYEFEFEGQLYQPVLQIDQYSAGRFIDIMTLTQDQDQILENLHLIIACLLDPVDKYWYKSNKVYEYNEIPIQDTAEKVLKHMKIDDAMALALFFWKIYAHSYQIIQDSLEESDQKNKMMSSNPLKMILNQTKQGLNPTNSDGDGGLVSKK